MVVNHLLRWTLPLALLAGLSACGGATNQAEPPRPLTVSGSGSGTALLEALARSGSLDGVQLDVLEGTDSAGGIAAVNARAIDVAAVSRPPKPGEQARGVTFHPFAKDGIAFVGQDGGVSSLTREQLLRVFAGKATNWRELGGANLPIRLFVRDEDESVTQELRRVLFGERFRFAPTATVLFSTGDMNDALARTRGALGFTSNGSLVTGGSPVRRLRVEGMFPTVAAIHASRYPFTRQIGVVFRPEPAVSAFVARLKGAKVRLRLQKLGYASIG